jgi:hypothetical protein
VQHQLLCLLAAEALLLELQQGLDVRKLLHKRARLASGRGNELRLLRLLRLLRMHPLHVLKVLVLRNDLLVLLLRLRQRAHRRRKGGRQPRCRCE